LDRFIIRCGYGRELEPDDERGPELLTPWDHGIEGADDYFLPKPTDYRGLRNQRGGVYEVRRKKWGEGEWEGVAGSLPEEYMRVDHNATFF
jgi:hypothetical protein